MRHPQGPNRRAEFRRPRGLRSRPAGRVDLPAQFGTDDTAIAGVDLVFECGDFFPGWTDAQGRSIHVLEIEATAAM